MLGRRNLHALAIAVAVLLFAGSPAFADSLVLNGTFESGYTSFSSAYTYVAAPGPSALWNERTFAVGDNPRNYHSLWASYGPYAGAKMMIVNGATVADVDVWWTSAAIAVTPATTYYFSAWIASAYPTNPATLRFSINDVPLGLSFTASTTPGLWQQFFATWNSGASAAATLSLLNMNTIAGGNDFTLDNLSLDVTRPIGATETTIPEPGSMLLLGSGLIGLAGAVRRRIRK